MMITKYSLCILLWVLLCGCGSKLPELVPVSGRVQFDGAPPPAAGIVNFLPVEGSSNVPTRPGSGRFGLDGAFAVTSFNGTKGLVPGRYHVRVECFARDPQPVPGDYEKASHVPTGYQPPDLTIEPGQRAVGDLVYNVPKKK
jgi:hypothetical protein